MHRMLKPTSSMELDDALEEIQSCAALILDGDILMYPKIFRETREDGEKLFFMEWMDADKSYEICFLESENEMVSFSGSNMYLIDDDGEQVEIKILTEKSIKGELQDSI